MLCCSVTGLVVFLVLTFIKEADITRQSYRGRSDPAKTAQMQSAYSAKLSFAYNYKHVNLGWELLWIKLEMAIAGNISYSFVIIV